MQRQEIEQQARLLAGENRQADPSITKVYWFPDDHEVRLIAISPTIPANDDGHVHPFFFRPSPPDDLPAPSGVAMARPDEVRKVQLPPGWGDWNDAEEI